MQRENNNSATAPRRGSLRIRHPTQTAYGDDKQGPAEVSQRIGTLFRASGLRHFFTLSKTGRTPRISHQKSPVFLATDAKPKYQVVSLHVRYHYVPLIWDRPWRQCVMAVLHDDELLD